MSDDDKFTPIACGIVAVLVGIAVLVGTLTVAWRNDAVDRGHAEYYLDAKHERQWRWKTNCVSQAEASKP